MSFRAGVVAIGVMSGVLWGAGVASAQDDEEGGVAGALPLEDAPQPPSLDDLLRRLEEQDARIEDLEARATQQDATPKKESIVQFHGYADVGGFVPVGNEGVGWIRDFGNTQLPQFAGQYGWVFVGDILATTINTRGEVADLGDAPGATRFDSVDSGGAPGFIINEVNTRMDVQVAETAILRTSLNVIPRTGSDFALGDFVELDIAELEWVVTDDGNTSLFVGKMLPIFGIEYKERKSDERFNVTPSLIHRYTSGPQLGLKARSKFLDGWVIAAASVTNNSATTEQFHFYNEVDTNSGKTLNGRLAAFIDFGRFSESLMGHTLEIGFSGTWGSQDRASNNAEAMWFFGVDLELRSANYALRAQWMRGESPGLADELVWGLDLNDSGYVSFQWMVLPQIGIYLRAGLRDAFVELSTERAYLTKSMRFTGGVRAVLNPNIAIKAEYLHNREFGGIEEFTNDILTSSLVLSY